jgi:uncharacterized sulfatase
MSQPNIIVFFSDQQRWDTVGAYGQKMDVTPNLDRMAAEGVRFEHAFTCQPVCGPARACIQTGKWATQLGTWRNDLALPLDQKTMAHWLTEAGYEVGYIGKWHLASNYSKGGAPAGQESVDLRREPIPPHRRGGYKDFWIASDVLESTSHGYGGYMFDADGTKLSWDEDTYRVDAQTEFVLDYLRSRDGEKPFFLFVSYIEPHHQNDRKHYEGPAGSKERFADFTPPGDLAAHESGDWKQEYPDYLGAVNALDGALGRIRSELERLELADDTLVIYTSDHGSHFRTRNGEYKRSCHEGSVRVPFVAAGPGFAGGKVVDELVSLIDLPTTILRAAGSHVPDYMAGRPLQELVDGPTERPWRSEVFMQISEDVVGRAIRTERWKYGVWAPDRDGWNDADAGRYVERYLYDLQADPHELDNLVSSDAHAQVRSELREGLIANMVAAGEEAPQIDPAQ